MTNEEIEDIADVFVGLHSQTPLTVEDVTRTARFFLSQAYEEAAQVVEFEVGLIGVANQIRALKDSFLAQPIS